MDDSQPIITRNWFRSTQKPSPCRVCDLESTKRYPLEVLLEQRAAAVDAHARVLHDRIAAARQAEHAHREATRQRSEHEQHTAQQTQQETDRFDDGEASVQDIARLGAWRMAQTQRTEQLMQGESRAQERERVEMQRAEDARTALAHVHAEAKAIEQHRERFRTEQRRAGEGKAESEMEDLVHAAIHRGHRRML